MNRRQAQKIVEQFPSRRIVVLGDMMLDEFIWGEVRRISPEAPVPVVEVKRESWHLGGAGNVVSNLIELRAQAVPVGVLGDDAGGALLRAKFAERGVDDAGLIVDASRPTTRKTRVVAHNQQMVRADRESRALINTETEDRILAAFTAALDGAHAVVISDYDKGLLTPRVLATAIENAHRAGLFVCLDPKIKHFAHYRRVDLITPNQAEAERAAESEITDEASLLATARAIKARLACRHVLITRGEYGMALLEEEGRLTNIPAVAREVYDVTGAGDTVIATLALALATGNASLLEAASIANHAAGVVVGKVGTATLTATELVNSIS